MKRVVTCGLSIALLAGCAISQKVEPAKLNTRSICVVENDKVRETFRDAIVTSLQERGMNARIAKADVTATECPARIMYSANWTWDLAMYMRRAELIVFEGDRMAGRATYDASGGGGRLDKFIDAGIKVKELVDELFPVIAAS